MKKIGEATILIVADAVHFVSSPIRVLHLYPEQSSFLYSHALYNSHILITVPFLSRIR
jgi:hypothetical protein